MEPVDPGDLADWTWSVEDNGEAHRTARPTAHEKNIGQVARYNDLTNMGALPLPFELDNLVKFPEKHNHNMVVP